MIDNLTEDFTRLDVSLVYLFGSQKEQGLASLTGKPLSVNPESDLDVGVLFEEAPKDVYQSYGSLYALLSECFPAFQIDLVILNEVNVFLQYEAIKGERIYTFDERVAEDFEENVMIRAEDLYYKKKEFDREVSEAIRDGYFEIELG